MYRAGELRREPPPAERKLWAYLRGDTLNGVNFRRHTRPGGRYQGHAIENFIVDFAAIKRKLDGSQHLEQKEYDVERTRYLELQGYKVIRFWNNDVMNNINGVIRAIELALKIGF